MQVYRVDASVMMKHSAKFFVKASSEDEAKRFVGGNINSLSHEFEPDDIFGHPMTLINESKHRRNTDRKTD